MHKPIHIHKNKLDRNSNIFLLLIPIIIFALVLSVILWSFNKNKYVATNEEPSVLGEQENTK